MKENNYSYVVAVKDGVKSYPKHSPYNPSIAYPEYLFSGQIGKEENNVYEGVRSLFLKLDYDTKNFGTPQWNPLGHIIKPGMKVVIKPNFVLSHHPSKSGDLYSIITHPSLIRAVADYCLIALGGRGRLVIADAPQYDCNFSELLAVTKIDEVAAFLSSQGDVDVMVRNLSSYWSRGLHFPSEKILLAGDPEGTVAVDLGEKSFLQSCPHPERFYGAAYHRRETFENHSFGKHNYELSKTILNADVLVAIPKMKVHKKVGVTLNLKGMVGANTNKNLIVHYRLGSPSEGGDQFPDNFFTPRERAAIRFERWMYDRFLAKQNVCYELIHRFIYGFLYLRVFQWLGFRIPPNKRLLDAGNWYGNDSCWRMVVDLARIIYFVDSEGSLKQTVARRFFSVIDGVMGGEGNGPLSPDAKMSGILIGGEDLIAVDIVASRIMGFDVKKMKMFLPFLDKPFLTTPPRNSDTIRIVSDNIHHNNYNSALRDANDPFLSYRPHPGWRDYLEI